MVLGFGVLDGFGRFWDFRVLGFWMVLGLGFMVNSGLGEGFRVVSPVGL